MSATETQACEMQPGDLFVIDSHGFDYAVLILTADYDEPSDRMTFDVIESLVTGVSGNCFTAQLTIPAGDMLRRAAPANH